VREYFNATLNRWFAQRNDGTWTYRYRLAVENHLGRRLHTDEHVHHVNGDPTDDRIENLIVASAKEHRAYHAADIPAWAHKGWQHEWARDYPCCVECGTTERKHTGHGLCSRCYFRNLQRVKHGHSPRRPAIVVTKTCPHCGEEFTRRGADKVTKYCSRKCAGRGDRGYKKQKAAA
jgi:hypothetical protein